jgi:hypothetical protein
VFRQSAVLLTEGCCQSSSGGGTTRIGREYVDDNAARIFRPHGDDENDEYLSRTRAWSVVPHVNLYLTYIRLDFVDTHGRLLPYGPM